jgi:PAS domain S-box-containing protein
MVHTLEAIPAGITVASLDGRLLYLNQRILKALGYTSGELVGRRLEVLYGTSLPSERASAIREATLAGGWKGEILNQRKDGSSFPVYLETSVIRDPEGAPMAFVAVSRDISEQRAFQERMLAEAKLGTLGVIAHNVAHEVRNHLSAIKLSLYLLQQATAASDQEMHRRIAEEELDRIELFLRTLESYANPPHPSFSEWDLAAVVNHGLEHTRPLLIQKSISLRRQFPENPPRLRLDRDQFAQAVTQVAQNATEALAVGGEIHVVIKRQGMNGRTWWIVEIRDNGPGIAPHVQDRVFEAFFTTTPNQLGLGLSNVVRIMNLHGGKVMVGCPPPGGTVVSLKLPGNEETDP